MMNIEQTIMEIVRTFISYKMCGLIIRRPKDAAIRTMTNNDGDAVIFAINKEAIIIKYIKKDRSMHDLAIINKNTTNIESQLKEIMDVISEDYEGKDAMWPNIDDTCESFEPSDWWKYGTSPNF